MSEVESLKRCCTKPGDCFVLECQNCEFYNCVKGATMNEVTKLYENAGVEPVLFYDCESYNQKVEKGYLFTAEKQLEIIKLLAKWEITIVRLLDTWYFSTDGIIGIFKLKGDFEEALANYINLVWQDLTEEERAEIKNILEM